MGRGQRQGGRAESGLHLTWRKGKEEGQGWENGSSLGSWGVGGGLGEGCPPLMVRCTQLPLWKVSYCWSSMRTLHSYQPWSSERTCSSRRDALS